MTGPFPLIQTLPDIPVTVYAGQPVTITLPVLGAGGTGVDVAGLAAGRAHIRQRWDAELLLHAFDTATSGAALTGTPGGTNAALVLTASSAETALWQQAWPRLVVEWDAEVQDTMGVVHRLCAASPWTVLPEITRVG